MKHNEILDEIYRARARIALESGGDSQQLIAWMRAEEEKACARGVKFASSPTTEVLSEIVRDEPPSS